MVNVLRWTAPVVFDVIPYWSLCFLYRISPNNYQFVMALIFAIEEINRNPTLLPNMTLGYNIYSVDLIERETVKTVFRWFTGQDRFIPNYTCKTEEKSVAAITGTTWEISSLIGIFLGLYKYPQVRLFWWEERKIFSFDSIIWVPRRIISGMIHFDVIPNNTIGLEHGPRVKKDFCVIRRTKVQMPVSHISSWQQRRHKIIPVASCLLFRSKEMKPRDEERPNLKKNMWEKVENTCCLPLAFTCTYML